MRKYMRSIILFFLIVLCSCSQVYGSDSEYIDVNESDWYYNNVQRLSSLGIINGYENLEFRPNNSIRANEFIKLILTALGEEIEASQNDKWDMPYIKRAEQIGLTNKNIVNLNDNSRCVSASYSPRSYYGIDEYKITTIKIINDYNDYITREQVAAIISNALAYKNIGAYKEYLDRALDYCTNYVEWFEFLEEEKKVAEYLLTLDNDKIYFNILNNKECDDVDIIKFKYTRDKSYSLYSNMLNPFSFSKENSFININSLEYDYTYKYIPSLLKDFNTINDLYVYDVIDLYLSGIMQGSSSGLFNPRDTITRAETAAVILRLMFDEERLTYDIKDAKKYVCPDGTILVAPSLNGEPVNEIIDICNVASKNHEKTIGIEVIDAGKNRFTFYGFENQDIADNYSDYMSSLDVDTFYLLEHMNDFKNFYFEIDINNFSHYTDKFGPYDLTLSKNWNYVEDSEFEGKIISQTSNRYIVDYPYTFYDYFVKYYYNTLYDMFNYFFEDETNVAWELLKQALIINETNKPLDEKNYIEIKKIINNRAVIFRYDNRCDDVRININLKK